MLMLFPPNQKDESSDEDSLDTHPGRRNFEDATKEDLDESGLPDRQEVGAIFRQAERRRGTGPFPGIDGAELPYSFAYREI